MSYQVLLLTPKNTIISIVPIVIIGAKFVCLWLLKVEIRWFTGEDVCLYDGMNLNQVWKDIADSCEPEEAIVGVTNWSTMTVMDDSLIIVV